MKKKTQSKTSSKKSGTKGAKTMSARKGKAATARAVAAKDAPVAIATGKPKRTSALAAAAEVLRTAGAPMRCKDLIAAMRDQGLWASPNGKTPEATLYSAILREIGKKADQSRFHKTDRGLFEANA